MALFKGGSFTPDPWRRLDDLEALPSEGYVILNVDQWRGVAQRPTNLAFGLLLAPSQPVEAIAADVPFLSLIAVQFPKFTDGRGYSIARQLRQRCQFTGELRATGDILFDQLQFLARCGFDAFEISDPVTIRLLQEGGNPDAMRRFYQPGDGPEEPVGTSPWTRRSLL
ncbi:MAG: DUF934 domain-containing protein [Methylovirgula sp.]